MFSVIEDAIALGLRRFDFLRGEESYKQHWRPHLEATYRVELRRSALRESECTPPLAA
jgi:CelD/BcsL family acetyltransferase involved in cellulose biosynthesis